jgi:uncharacterized protein (DUF58 family)
LRIIRELIEFKPSGTKTNISEALRYFTNVIKKKCIAFILSDFMDSKFDDALKIISRKHDTIAMQVYDERETEIPDLGIVQIIDSETGQTKWVDTSSTGLRKNYSEKYKVAQEKLNNLFLRSNVDVIRIRTDQSYIVPLMTFFKKRGKRA